MVESGKIVGGEDALSPIPWQVLIKRPVGYCGATILDSKTLLSAGHCFKPVGQESINTMIRVGSLKRRSGGQVLKLTDIILLPSYLGTPV